MCNISLPIGANRNDPVSVPVSEVVDIGGLVDGVSRSTITASVAVQIDTFSLMVVAYTSPSGINSIGIVSVATNLHWK